MDLATLWFFIVGVLFVGYFVLDGFDFGVGMSLPFLGKDEVSRRQVINTIGPVWDLNETWVIVAGACLFAAFPEWYATLFSGFYLPLLLILLALIVRGVSFEYRHQRDDISWKRRFDWMITIQNGQCKYFQAKDGDKAIGQGVVFRVPWRKQGE